MVVKNNVMTINCTNEIEYLEITRRNQLTEFAVVKLRYMDIGYYSCVTKNLSCPLVCGSSIKFNEPLYTIKSIYAIPFVSTV